jgi:hypothetical protein
MSTATAVCCQKRQSHTICMILLLLTDADSAGREGSACCCAALRGSSLHSSSTKETLAAQRAVHVEFSLLHAEPSVTAMAASSCKEFVLRAHCQRHTQLPHY